MDSFNTLRIANSSEWNWPKFSQKSKKVDGYDRPESFEMWFRRSTCILGRSIVQVTCFTPLALRALTGYSSRNNLMQYMTLVPASMVFMLGVILTVKALEIFKLYKNHQGPKNIANLQPISIAINTYTAFTTLTLVALGHPLLALTTIVVTMANSIFWYSYAYLPPSPPKSISHRLSCQTDAAIRQKILDLPELQPGESIDLNFSFSKINDSTLNMIAAHVFKHPKHFEGNLLNLRGCHNITKQGVTELLKRYPKLHLDLTDCGIVEHDIYDLRYRFPKANLEYYPVYQGLVKAFHSEQYCDISFLIEDREIKAHKFIFAAFDKIPDTSQRIAIDGITHDEFKIILEEIYSGKLQDENRQKLPGFFVGTYNPRYVEKLFNNPKYGTDFIIGAKGKEFHVHRAILGHLSEYFETRFSTGMREAIEMKMVMSDWSAKDCQCILNSFYKPQVFHDLEDVYEKIAGLLSNQLSYQWQQQAVKSLIKEETVTQWLELAVQTNMETLKKGCLDYIKHKYNISLSIEAEGKFGLNLEEKSTFSIRPQYFLIDSLESIIPREIVENISHLTIGKKEWIDFYLKVISKIPKLKVLNTSSDSNHITLKDAQKLQLACPGSSWRNLHLSGTIIVDDPTFDDILNNNPNIEHLYVDHLRILETKVWKAICSLTQLKSLKIDNNS